MHAIWRRIRALILPGPGPGPGPKPEPDFVDRCIAPVLKTARTAADLDWSGLIDPLAATLATPPTEPFADLGLLPAERSSPRPAPDRSAWSTAAASWHEVDMARQGAGRTAPARNEAARHDAGTMICDGLHAEFTRAMHDPAFATGRTAWSDPADIAPAFPTTLDELARAAGARRPLLDLLAGEADNDPDAVLAHYAEANEHDLYARPRPPDVLQLFAPTSAPTDAARTTLPSQAVRDQHRWSLDTCLDGRTGALQAKTDA